MSNKTGELSKSNQNEAALLPMLATAPSEPQHTI